METTGAPILNPLGCLLVGAAVGTLAWSARTDFPRWLGYVERDLADKLRRLRVPTHTLHRYVVAWLGATAANFLLFWLVLESPVFAVLLSRLPALRAVVCSAADGPAAAAEDRRSIGRRHGHAGQRRAGGPVAGPVDGRAGRAMPQPDQSSSSARSWASTTWASRWSRRCRRPARGCGARISPSLPRR